MTPPKIPTKVKILNHVYKVIEVDEISDDTLADSKEQSGDQILGLLDDTSLQILLVKNIQPSRKYQIFLHEVFHAVFNVIEFRRFLKDQDSEDSVVNSVSDIVFQVLADNEIIPFGCDFEPTKPSEDTNLIHNLKFNYEKGTSIRELSKAFQLSEKEIKEIVGSKTKKKGKRKQIIAKTN